jgi:pimeloyl-ACP methyl ester carboxylesterase
VPGVSLPPVLLVHGFASSFERNWREPGFVDLLEDAGRTVIPFDFMGHGTAPKSHDPADYLDLAGDLLAALPSDGQVDAIAFSMGASTLLRAAVRAPERFRRVVVAGIGQNLFQVEGRRTIASALATEGTDDEDVETRMLRRFMHGPGNDPEALRVCAGRREPAMDPGELAVLTGPVLVVIGDQDRAGPADGLAAALPSSSLVVLPRTEHYATARSFAFYDAALDFIAKP